MKSHSELELCTDFSLENKALSSPLQAEEGRWQLYKGQGHGWGAAGRSPQRGEGF